MGTFAMKPRAAHQARSAGSAKASQTLSGQRRDVHSILQSQRTIGNRAVQRLLRTDSEVLEVESAGASEAEAGADRTAAKVSGLAAHSPAQGHALPRGRLPPGLSSVSSRSPGPETRRLMESHSGHDFSNVRVSDDIDAAGIATAARARAFTSGRHIVSSRGEYQPGSAPGRRLLAHEPARVVEQQSRGTPQIQRVPLPDYEQRGDTCDPASMLTALITWDRERADPVNPNRNIVGILDAALLLLTRRRAEYERLWGGGVPNGATRVANALRTMTDMRNRLLGAGTAVAQTEYQDLATILSNFDSDPELVLQRLGLRRPTSTPLDTLGAIFGDPQLTGLTPGQVAQIHWYTDVNVVSTAGPAYVGQGLHAFLIGRSQTGTWYLSNQGDTPPLHLEAPSLPALRAALDNARNVGRTRLVTAPTFTRRLLEWTGIKILPQQDYSQPMRNLAPPGTFLAEVDAGWTTTGEQLHTWDFVGTAYTLAAAQALFAGTGLGHGFLVGEMPAGVFNVYKTNPVGSANANVTSIDTSDSAGGLLVQPTRVFLHAWLKLRTAAGTVATGSFFGVY